MSRIVKEHFKADGMTCHSCEKIIEKQAMKVPGVKSIKIDYATQEGEVKFDSSKTNIDEILYKIEEGPYECSIIKFDDGSSRRGMNFPKPVKSIVLTLALLVILFGGYQMASSFSVFELPTIGGPASFLLLFAVGALTGFHCVGMCGGFIMSYTSKKAVDGKKDLHVMSHVQYGVGKLVSYTAIGALFGFIGTIFIFTPMIRGMAAIFAGIFLILFGISMLNIFPALRKVRIPVPKAISRFTSKNSDNEKRPLVTGLLTGLMLACGPLQALYIYAAGTGRVVEGAMALFAFGLGTLPVMFGFGIFASYVSKSMTRNILKASGLIVLVLGVVMLNRGVALTGTGYDFNSVAASFTMFGQSAEAAEFSENMVASESGGYQEIRMDVTRYGWEPDKFVLKAGVPVRWIINGKEINGCNNAIQVPKLGLDFDIKSGEQVIEFTPESEGIIPWSCWMGMIPGTFIVKNDIDLGDTENIQKELESVAVPKGGSCGGSTCGAKTGGSCGCGG